ncbi:MAG: hypothetical protein BGO43_01765 [Gammaproteobacteria bacterium 39-13]|nr:agmatine deiminase family protein [Gammaproteobacteria bacterium]OJV91811.1 MAG: hypothetical protein BGO43_01765 [Gammaproteobacteria bacterium 39-13]
MAKRLPAEWEPQTAVLLTWPHAQGAWGQEYHHVETVFIAVAKAIANSGQTVLITAYDMQHQEDILNKLASHQVNMNFIQSYLAPSNDIWARDHGPITCMNEKTAIQCDFKFNAWGKKYDYEFDDAIPSALFKSQLLKGYLAEKIDFVLEGGSIETDGQGTLLTTTQCLGNPHRNSNLSLVELEQYLHEYLGFDHFLWLSEGKMLGDDTDCHIDTLARFINPNTIAYVHCDDPNDPHYKPLLAMKNQLEALRNKEHQPYQLVPLPLPSPHFDGKGNHLPATYANFLITNQLVLVPLYQDKLDSAVLEIFQHHFPEREIIGIDCRALIEQYGSLHCMTMQIPQVLR